MKRYMPTRFAEANALLYLAEGDVDEANDVLDAMTHAELANLKAAAHELVRRCETHTAMRYQVECRRKRRELEAQRQVAE